MWDEDNPDIEEFVVRTKKDEPTFFEELGDLFFLGARDKAPVVSGGGGSKSEPEAKEAFVFPGPEVTPEVVVTGTRIATAISVPAAAAAVAIVAAATAVASVLSDQALEKALERIKEPEPEPKPEPKPEPQPQPELETVTVRTSPEMQTFTVSASPAAAGGGSGRGGVIEVTPAFEEAPPDWIEIGLRQDLGPFGAEATPKTDVSKVTEAALKVLQQVLDPFGNVVPQEIRLFPTEEAPIRTKPAPQVEEVIVPEAPIEEIVVPGTRPQPSAPVVSEPAGPGQTIPIQIEEPAVVVPPAKEEKPTVPDELMQPAPTTLTYVQLFPQYPVEERAGKPAPQVEVVTFPVTATEPIVETQPITETQPIVQTPVKVETGTTVTGPVSGAISTPLTPVQEAVVPFTGRIEPPKTQQAQCAEQKKPRTVCYRGYYREFRDTERKVRWERVPCEPRPRKKRKR